MQSEQFNSQYISVLDGQTELADVCDEIDQLDLKETGSEPDTCVLIDEENETQVIKTKLRLCRNKHCEGCNNLHLCKLDLLGNCPYNKEREGCQFSHDIHSEHNVGVLCQHRLLELDLTELHNTLLQNDTTLLPSVCLAYNEGSGKFGNCLEAETCEKLHVCKNYIKGICDGSAECRRCHDFYEPHPSKALQGCGVSSQLMVNLLTIYKNMFIIADADEPSINSNATATDVICLFHFQNSCDLENTCEHLHFYLPYKWEKRDEHSWNVLPDNEEIERAFCDPSKTQSDSSDPVHFDSMTQSFVEVRRLSTISAVWDPSFTLTTKWIWYWEDECGNWIPFDLSEGTQHISSITNELLECKYQENSNVVIKFATEGNSYEVNMQEMIQYNKKSSTKTRVRRRPVFLSAEDVQNVMTREMESKDLLQICPALPGDSDDAKTPVTGFKRILLNSGTNEYKKITERFYQTMSEFNVKSIEKMLNEDLWEIFQRHVNVMNQKNVGKENVKLLFHGAESKQIDAICQQNIEWRTYEPHEMAYGMGSYFTRDAKSSQNYTDKSGTQCMFLCWVFIGDYTIGHPSYIQPPVKDGENGVLYNSCVDDVNSPSTFVVFEKHQVYPAYLIQYEQGPIQFSSSSQTSFSDPSVSSQICSQNFMPQFHFTTPTFVPFVSPPIAPKFHYIPVVRSRFFAYSKQKYLQPGAGLLPFPHYYKPPLIRHFTVSNPTRPPKRQGPHGGFRSVHSPVNPRTAASVSKDTAKRMLSNTMRSAGASRSMPLPVTSSTVTKESKSAKTQGARQQTPKPASGLYPENSPGIVSSGTKSSKSYKTQYTRHQGSNSTKSSYALSQGTTSVSASTYAKSQSEVTVRSENARAKKDSSLSSRPKNSSETENNKPAAKSYRSSDMQSTNPAGKSFKSSAPPSSDPAGKSSKSSAPPSSNPAGKSSKNSAPPNSKPAGKSSKSSAPPSSKPAGKCSKSSAPPSSNPAGKCSKSSAPPSSNPAGKSSKSSARPSSKPAGKRH